jgi:tRNA(His) guanylyltransferase
MSKMEALGDRMKSYEMAEAGRIAMKGVPLIARLDGRAFHTYTKGLKRPYDERLSKCMVDTMKYLVEETHAIIGYVQSDEITLLWNVESDSDGEYMFSGRFQKMTSVLAGMASAYFTRLADELIPEKKNMLPIFDCRVWQVPNRAEAANAFYWRELDATKNAVSMAAHAYFSHKELQGKTGAEKQEMLFSVHGINFNDYPAFFKRGVYAKRVTVFKTLDDETLAKIPEARRPVDGLVCRSEMQEMDWPACRNIGNFENLIFGVETEVELNR